jgi:hypothetical protein
MSMLRRAIVVLWVLLVAGCSVATKPSEPTSVASRAGVRILTAAQDPQNGPCVQTDRGCIALNPDVSAATIRQTICVAGYTKSVRPGSSYTNGVKRKLMGEEGLDPARKGDYELDHIVPLGLGGHPRKLSNLMLQPWDGPQGAHMKDILEARLQHLVCAGDVALADAQVCIATDWQACAARYADR